MNEDLKRLVEALANELSMRNLTLATAESCTGGGVGSALTAIPGSSLWYVGGIIAYNNSVKSQLLHVASETLDVFGAVSEETARAMQLGVLQATGADLSLSTTGVAGPGGGTKNKPVGTVCFAWGALDEYRTTTYCFDGGRDEVRMKSVETAIKLVHNLLNHKYTV